MSASRGNPTREHVTAEAIESALLNLRVATVGIVQSYDENAHTCVVQSAIRRPLETVDGEVVNITPPIVTNVMVVQWGSSSMSSHTPLVKGDAVLLVYLDYSPAQWRERSEVSDPIDTEGHGASYPVAFPFFRPQYLGPGGAPDIDMSIGVPSGMRIRFYESHARVAATPGDSEDFVALKSAVDAIQQNLDSLASFGTPFGPTTPGNLVPAGAQASSTKLKA